MQSVVRSSLVGLLAIASLTACGDKVSIVQPSSTAAPTVVHGVVVTPNSVPNLQIGSSVTLSAAVDADAAVTDRTVTWASSDATIASVDATGKVTGVKAGTVTISAAAKADPTVKGAALVTVGGAANPIVTISSILQNPTNVPANLANAFGQLDVVLNVDPNGAALKTISATLKCGNDSVTQTQTIGANVAALDADEAAAPVTLSFNTAAFTVNSAGAALVALHNGQCTITATATTTGNQTATNTQTLTLNNIDGVLLTNSFAAISNAEGVTQPTTATDAGGLPWRSGSLTVLVTPVLYSNRTVSSVSITVPGAQVPTQTITAAPFSATWSGSSTSGSAPTVTGRTLVGSTYEANGTTPVGITPSVVVLDAAGNDLALNVFNQGIVGNTTFRLDNTAPQPPLTFITPTRQAGWVNGTYTFTGTGGTGTSAKFNACGDGPTVAGSGVCAPQIGVSTSGTNSTEINGVSQNNGTTLTTGSFNSGTTGLTTFTFYSIPAANYTAAINTQGTSTSATTCSTTGWTKIATGGDLAATLANNVYVVRMFETDKLGNARCTDLANALGIINTGGFSLATVGKFGVDKVAPTAAYVEPATDATAAGNLGTLANGGNLANFNIKIALSDDASGFSATPVTTMVQRLAIDPATGAAAGINTAFGCPNQGQATTATSNLSSGACSTQSTAANVPGNFGVTVADGTPTNPGCPGCGYYFFTQTPLDLARNAAPVMTRQVVYDIVLPTVGGIAVPATVTGGTSVNFATSASDNLDLVNTDYTLTYAASPTGNPVANLPIRATGPNIGVAFDNTLTTAASFSVTVPFFIRSIATTGAADAPQNNGGAVAGGLASSIAVRAYDAAHNTSAPGTAAIAPANVPQVGATNFTVAPAGANPGATMLTFAVGNAATNISNCPAAGCAGNVAPVNPQSVTLTAVSTGNEGATFQFINPFTQVQFYYFDTTVNEYVLIGTAVAPVVTDNAAITIRTFTWTLTTAFDPPAALGAGTTLKVIAIGVNAAGDGLASAVNANITLTNP